MVVAGLEALCSWLVVAGLEVAGFEAVGPGFLVVAGFEVVVVVGPQLGH